MRSFLSAAWLLGALVAVSPQLLQAQVEEAAFVDDGVCADCHDELAAAMATEVHGRVRDFEVTGRQVGCQGCHGPASLHVDSGGEILPPARYGPEEASDGCLSCHRSKGQAAWKASVHAAEGLGCSDCHGIHEERSPLASCDGCHVEVMAEFRLPSRHPLREGQLSCASCHDVHGMGVALLAGDAMRVNDACYDCHQEKEGPFVFEHAPVEESCANCHRPHGSVANNLLTLGEPALCLQCHELHFHAGYQAAGTVEVDVGGIEHENTNGPGGFSLAFATRCTQCHAPVHGTDLPSQTVTNPGGLTR